MIACHLLEGTFEKRSYTDFDAIAAGINTRREHLAAMPIDAIIRILDALGKRVLRNAEINTLPGVSYISLWLRRENLEKICTINYADRRYADGFRRNEQNLLMTARPRGIVCQWIAANMPTLGFFSLVQVILSKNGSIVKMPEEYVPLISAILRELPEIEVGLEGNIWSGRIILDAIAIVSFEGREQETSAMLSRVADCRIIYGSGEAIRAISRLPCRDHCETIIFGPKYSFAVFDREYIESGEFRKALDSFAKDVAVFNQMACSSPHVLFLEKSCHPVEMIASWLRESFEKMPPALRHQPIPAGLSARIINARAEYLLSDDKNCIAPRDLSWTILINHEPSLEEPVQGKCIFLKEIDSASSVIPLVNHKIQAISIGISDPIKRKAFALAAADRLSLIHI